jgi:hypothetical protein
MRPCGIHGSILHSPIRRGKRRDSIAKWGDRPKRSSIFFVISHLQTSLTFTFSDNLSIGKLMADLNQRTQSLRYDRLPTIRKS